MAIIEQRLGKKRPQYAGRLFITSTWRGVLRVMRWPRARGRPKTVRQQSILDRFREVAIEVQRVSAREQNDARDGLDKWNRAHAGQMGSAAIRLRDLLTQSLTGRLWAFRLEDGTVVYHEAVRQDVSEALDWTEPRTGSLLIRTTRGWEPTPPCQVGAMLAITPDGGFSTSCPAPSPSTGPDAAPSSS